METLEAPAEFKALSEEGTFEGHAAVFGNVDLGGDVIEKGAFRKTLMAARKSGRMPRFLLHHDPRSVIGIFTDVHEDSVGLSVKGRFNLDKQVAREALSDVRMGAINGLSIGFRTVVADTDKRRNVRILKEIELFEASLVTFPMNEEARITSVKQMIRTKREFETFLRDVGGFSANAAKAIASRGFQSSDGLRDGADDAFTRELERLARKLNGD